MKHILLSTIIQQSMVMVRHARSFAVLFQYLKGHRPFFGYARQMSHSDVVILHINRTNIRLYYDELTTNLANVASIHSSIIASYPGRHLASLDNDCRLYFG
jgi:hypothetical protein